MYAVFGNVEVPSSVQTLCTGTDSGMSLFNHAALIYSPSLSDEMLCSLFCPFPNDNNSTVHPTVTTVITKKTDPSHKPMLDGNVRILRGAIFSLGSLRYIIAFSGAQSYWCHRQRRVSESELKDRSPVPVVCTSHQKLHLFYKQICYIFVFFSMLYAVKKRRDSIMVMYHFTSI